MDGTYSLDDLLKFLDFGADKGLFNRATAQSRKTAAKKVLSGLEDDEKSDLRNLDLDGVFARFMNLSSGEYTPDSLQVYKARVNTAVGDFIKWRDNPAAFKPAATQRKRSAANKGEELKRSKSRENEPLNDFEVEEFGGDSGGKSSAAPLVFPIPLRDRSVIVRISNLPSDLTHDEAKRVSAVMQSLSGYLAALASDKAHGKDSNDGQR